VQIFGLYILFFGQYGPGGGFVGGVILGTSLILGILVFGPDDRATLAAKRITKFDGVGLLIFVGIGGLCLIGGGEFLDYAELEVPGMTASGRRYLGIVLAQIGVALDIAVTAVSIVFSLSVVSGAGGSRD
jgi:multicomponent Na+:H+ antiporter subunit B